MFALSRPGSDRLSRVLRRSTIGAGAFHGRVRNGNGCGHPARTTRSAKGKRNEKLDFGGAKWEEPIANRVSIRLGFCFRWM